MNKPDWTHINAPEQLEFRNPEAILNLRDLKLWMNDLPLLMPDPTVRNLLEALKAINQQQISRKVRMSLLAEFRKTCLQLYPSLSQEALKRLSMKDVQRKSIHLLTTGLCMSISDGYRIILRDLLAANSQPDADELFLPLYHAAEMLSLAILNCYRSYNATAPALFRNQHQIYYIAETMRLAEDETERDALSLSAGSIGGIYRQTMILACLDPFHMPGGIAEKLHQQLNGLAQYCTLLSRVPDQDSSEIFVVDLATDEAPRPVYRISGHKQLQEPRVLDTQPLSNKIRADITLLQADEESVQNQHEISLLERLIPPERDEKTRKAERHASDRVSRVTFGIDAVFHFLTLDGHELQQVLNSVADSFNSHTLETWSIVNESSGGMNLQNRSTTRHDVRVGDIIGLLSETSQQGNAQGRIAVIRWIRHEQNDYLNIGIELVAGNILPATCRLSNEDEANSVCSGIFISSDNNQQTPATLLTPKGVYRRGRLIEVTIGDQPMQIEAGFLRDDTFTFDRFDFKSLNT